MSYRLGHFEDLLMAQARAVGLPAPMREHRVCETRRFRFDLAWPDQMVACEIDGAVWIGGRHSRGAGIQSDCDKACLAAIAGWRVLRVTTGMVRSGKAVAYLERVLKGAS